MKISSTFQLKVSCKKYIYGTDRTEGDITEIPLTLTTSEAGYFLFRFSEQSFTTNGYKVLFSNMNNMYISFHKDDDIYVVMNPTQFLSNVLEGYERLRFVEHLNHLMDLESEYWAAEAEDDAPIEDEELGEEEMKDPDEYTPEEEVEDEDLD